MAAQKAAAAKKAHAFKGGAYKLFAAAKWVETLAECSGVTGVTAVARGLKLFIERTIKGTGLACPAPYSQAS